MNASLLLEQNKLAKVGDVIAISKSETINDSLIHWLTEVIASKNNIYDIVYVFKLFKRFGGGRRDSLGARQECSETEMSLLFNNLPPPKIGFPDA